ncbi:MAG: hypothetical protein ABSG99_06115 [Sedimentisphaerales bacterium]
MAYYEALEKLDLLKRLETPTIADLEKARNIYAGDQELMRYFYTKNERGALSLGWLELLDGANEFAGLESVNEIAGRVKAFYIVDCAAKKPEAVLEIIKKVKIKDAWIQRKMLDAILAMPEDIAVQGMPVVLEYLGGRDRKEWYFIGEPAAELMVKLIEKYPREAFKIAGTLLDVWWPGEDAKSSLDNIKTRFTTHEYMELVFQYYNKVWEKRPFEAVRVLIEIYDKYLDEYNKEKKYDTSEYLGISVEDLENIGRLDYDLDAIIVKAICESGRAVVEKEPKEISHLLEDLEKRNKGIFFRVAMHLLRFVKEGTEAERINKMVGNARFIENRMYWYEHRRLLNDKFDEVGEEARKVFIAWVEKQKITEKKRKEVEELCRKNNEKLPDFEKWENQEKAEELYLVREREGFKELYEGYKAKSGLNDTALAPRPMVRSEARWVSPMEGTPLEPEAMGKMVCDAVLDYILEPKNYEGKKKAGEWQDDIYALQSTFKEDVKKRTLEYLRCDIEKLAGVPAEFLASFFYGAREGSFSKEGWKPLIELAALVVEKKNKEEGYRNCFHAILNALRVGFSREEDRIEFDEAMAKQFWSVVSTLVHFPTEDRSELGEERDPMQMSCIQVPGQALELTILLAVVCKKNFGNYWESNLKPEMRKCWEFVLREIKDPGVNCMFGIDFARMYWLDSKWFEKNLASIVSDELWDETWGTYVSWGRPSPECFEMLVEKGKYGQAVERIGSKNKYKFGKEPDVGLVEHLIIGYFNGWIDFENDVLKQFFNKASAELRGKAAEFMTTGFKGVNEEGGEEKEKVAVRMREYWNKRLAAIKENPGENKDEAIALAGWVDDSVLPAKETLELLEQSLDLSGGEIGEMRDAWKFIEGISKLGKGKELLALRCLKKAAADENMHMTWSNIQDPLVKFLEDLPENMWSEGKEVADLYGRYNPEKFRGVWEKLNVIKRSEE